MSGKDSQSAFYAADSGVECALYWDAKDPSRFDISAESTITCITQTISTGQAVQGTSTLSRIGGGGASNRTSVFGFVMNQGLNSMPTCSIVTVTKNADGSTYIKSRGYNTCDTSNLRRVERGIEVTY